MFRIAPPTPTQHHSATANCFIFSIRISNVQTSRSSLAGPGLPDLVRLLHSETAQDSRPNKGALSVRNHLPAWTSFIRKCEQEVSCATVFFMNQRPGLQAQATPPNNQELDFHVPSPHVVQQPQLRRARHLESVVRSQPIVATVHNASARAARVQ